MAKRRAVAAIGIAAIFAVACGPGGKRAIRTESKMESAVAEKLRRFQPTEIGVDPSAIPARLRPVIRRLVEAGRIIDRLFLIQVAKENPGWRSEIAARPELRNTLAYFDAMYGPWDRLDQNRPFWGNQEKPRGATFYPEDLSAGELEAWIAAHPDQQEAMTGYFTVIRRDRDRLVAVPYSEAYREELAPAAALLEEAAALADDRRLAKYLRSRAAAFRDNDYRPSDSDWMDLGDGEIEIVIGPYEVYEDDLLGYKASFEAFVALRDPAATADLARIEALIPEMERFLPVPEAERNRSRGAETPLAVVDLLFSAGEARAGIQTLAFNLPNDEVVRAQKGSKKVMLKNVARAKYGAILVPIARALLREDQARLLSFEAFFGHTLLHETAHGLGPGLLSLDRDGGAAETSVNQRLKDLYSTIEEAKADVLGIYLRYFLVERGLEEERFLPTLYASMLGGFFRAVRFGAEEAHGLANLIQLNYLIDKGAVVREGGRYAFEPSRMRGAVEALARELLAIEAWGDYGAAERLIREYGRMPPDLAAALASLGGIPTDIRPIYPVERWMRDW